MNLFSLNRFRSGVKSPAIYYPGGNFEVNNWTLSTFVVKKLVPIVGTHPFPVSELLLLAGAFCWTAPTHVFDWGTHIGKSARIFYETGRYFRIRSEFHSIDLPNQSDHQEHPGKQRGSLVRHLPSVHLHTGDGVTTALSILKQSKLVSTRPLFFLDGDHNYETVYRELTNILSTYPQAHLLVHDTFDQASSSGYNTGPHRAVVELLRQQPEGHTTLSVSTGLPGMTFLYPRRQ